MSSINFNQSATIALDTLRNINMNLQKVQNVISTGKEIANARDNAAIWSISTTMESDVSSFEAITNSLNLGASTVGVARSATEQITSLFKEMKTLVVSAQEENVDRVKIQRDVEALRDQIDSIVNAAQFNGLNLLKAGAAVELLSSLDRSSAGVVTPKNIAIDRIDLTQVAGTVSSALGSTAAGAVSPDGTTFGGSATQNVAAATPATATPATLDIQIEGGALTVADSTSAQVTFKVGTTTVTVDLDDATPGDSNATTFNEEDILSAVATALDSAGVPPGITYAVSGTGAAARLTFTNTGSDPLTIEADTTNNGATISDGSAGFVQVGTATGDTSTQDIAGATAALSTPGTGDLTFQVGEVAAGSLFKLTIGSDVVEYRSREGDTSSNVVEKLIARASTILPADVTLAATGGGNVITVTNGTGSVQTVSVTANAGEAGGALEDLANIDVTTSVAAGEALGDVEDMLDIVIDAAATFGSAQRRIDIQNDFVLSLIDSLNAGVSALTDANLEEASARLQSLQVQQQLNIQALTIANQSPQAILALFR
ncbi:MAG: flagellin N-terminal helical domain-containing protein [Parvularcula sp.]